MLRELARFPWGGPKRFVSLSLGYAARRLFCFVADGTAFPLQEFQTAIEPWLRPQARRGGRRRAAARGRRLLAPDLPG